MIMGIYAYMLPIIVIIIFLINAPITQTTLYNKCVNNFCTFNDESSIEYCNNIYKLFFFFYFEYSYIYCGKAPNDTFKKNKEYASKKCENGLCETLETFDMHKIRVNNEFYALI